MINVHVTVRQFWYPDFLIDPNTGAIVKAFFPQRLGPYTNTTGAPSADGISDPEIEHDALKRFGLAEGAQSAANPSTRTPPGPAAASTAAIDEARRVIPAALTRIYSALNDAGPQEAAGLLSADIIKSSRDVDYICQPFTYRAHHVVSIVEQPDGTFLARVRTLFKPFKERVYVFCFKKVADSYLAYRVDDDRFTQEGEAATDAVRQFIFAAKAGNWDLASRYASPTCRLMK